MMRACQRFGLLAALGCGLLAPLQAQTTGGLFGRVEDADGAVLPGVTVEAKSPALQGSRLASTDDTGSYRLVQLPPGEYAVTFTLEGFAPETAVIGIGLDRDASLNATLRPEAATAEITVTAQAPVIDTASTTLGTSLDTRAIETLPTGRNYTAIAQVVPGISSDAHPENTGQASITVYGSTGAENTFIVDGVNTTGVEYGFQGKELNFEFIQAVDVKTGGYEAEFGRATGGIISVITKSGGNEFHGDLFGYYDNDSLQSSPDPIVSTGGTQVGFSKNDFGVDLGGYLVKDKLWFFAAYDRVDHSLDSSLPAGPRDGEIVTTDSERDLAAVKLTYRLSAGQSVIGSFFQDPRDDSGAIQDGAHSLNGEPSTYEGVRSSGGRDYALRYEGTFDDWALSGQVARHEEENSISPSTGAGSSVQLRDVENDFFQTGGFGLIQQKSFQRDFAGGSATYYRTSHEIKGGIEYEEQAADVTRFYSGGQQVDRFPGGVFSHFYWTTLDATVGNAPLGALVAAPEHKNTAVYLQDRWYARPNLTVSLGVRWDRQEIIDAAGVTQIDLKDDYAPRIGVVWDPAGDSSSRVFASFGRYYEQLPMDLVIRSFSYERQARIFNFSPTSTTPDAVAEAELGEESAIFGGFTEPSDPNLENQYINEYLLGYERQVLPDVAVGIKGIYRNYGQVIEDFLCADDGTYCIGNPGQGIMDRVFTLDYSTTLPAPEAERVYRGVQLDVTKRFSGNWSGLASYVYSKLDGNFDGLYAPFTNIGPDPNITAAYDYFDFFTNGADLTRITNDGPLSNDRRHQFKVSGLYETPIKLAVGVSAYYRTGTPLTRYGYSDIYGRYEFFLSKRGGEGRTPDTYEADVHLGYPIAAGPLTVNVLLDVFNVLNAQRPVLLDQRYGFEEADNDDPAPANPGYLRPVLRTPPTSFRLGVRLSF